MSNAAIKVEHLSKRYRMGQYVGSGAQYRTLRESLTNAVSAPLRRLRSNSQSAIHDSKSDNPQSNPFIWALKDVSFEVKQGEVLGIIGRNGAGKSTLLKVLTRITEPTKGRAELNGRVGSLLEVGTGFHPELTGRENIYLSGAILGMARKEIDQKFDEIVEFSGVETYIDTPVKRYSSGMRVRLGFAVAAHLEPEILLVDEVLAVGDFAFQKKCLGKMQDVAGEGRTVLFVSHNMSAIQRLCPRTILLNAGSVHQDGDTQDVVANYLKIGMDQQGERVWPNSRSAPGDNVARLRAVRARNSKMQVDSKFSVQDSWYIEVEFDVLSPGHNININLLVYDMVDTLLFMIGDFQTAEWQNRPRPVGVHRSRCLIPGNLLNEGMLRVLVGVVTEPSTLRALDEDALFISIIDDGSTSGARGFFPANWPGGAVRPLVQWEYEYDATLGGRAITFSPDQRRESL